MLSREVKKEISRKVQAILRKVNDDELPDGEINFILHIDGKETWSWANIQNESMREKEVPLDLTRNLSVEE